MSFNLRWSLFSTPSHIYMREPWGCTEPSYSYSLPNCHQGPMVGSCHIEDLRRWGPWADRLTGLVSRAGQGANRPQLRLRGSHVSPYSFGTWVGQFPALVGSLIHVMIRVMLWLVADFYLGSISVCNLHFSLNSNVAFFF